MNIKTANRLCELRKAHNLSQEELADKLGVSRQAVSKWERSESSPDTDNLIQLASIYNMSLDELINGEEARMTLKEKVIVNEIKLNDTTKVLIEEDNAKVIKGDETRYFSVAEVLSWNDNINKKAKPITSISALIIVLAYLIIGFAYEYGFGNFWFLFILIPVPESIYHAIKRRDLRKVNIACIIASLYCALGMMIDFFHPGWVLFLLIPIFYAVTKSCYGKEEEMKQYVIDAYYKANNIKKEDD